MIGSSKHPSPKSKNNKAPIIAMSTVLVLLFLYIMSQLSSSVGGLFSSSEEVKLENGVQVISLNLSSAGYSPNHITVKKGIPVRFDTVSTADAGCVRGVMIPDFNINKALDVGNDSFSFTFDKTGSFGFSCQMKMSTGTITVT